MPRPARGKERADYLKEIAANRDHRSEVDRRLASLHGQSRADLEKDQDRGPVSSLGHGTGSMRRGKRK